MIDNVYSFFLKISSIPRETNNMERISNYLVNFAKEKGLEVYQDEHFNVLIKKKASNGYEQKAPIILQAHMDMVCGKSEESTHDFYIDGIEVIEEEGYLKANGTTLGADDGIGMAMILAILDGNYPHPPIEALFTVNEETTMEGASSFDVRKLKGQSLINLDSEEEGILTAGCAGATSLETILPGILKKERGNVLTIEISNLRGGHSGIDIDLGHVNAIKFITSEFYEKDYRLISITGGSADNAICNSVKLKLLVNNDTIQTNLLKDYLLQKLKEHSEEEANVEVNLEEEELQCFDLESSSSILRYLYNVPDGVYSYENNLPDMVCSSLNLGIIKTDGDMVYIHHLIRSSDEEMLKIIKDRVIFHAMHARGIVHTHNSLLGWKYQENSPLREYLVKKYHELFRKPLKIEVTHAGLECGLLVNKKKDLDCVSIGPNIIGAHTINEKVEISSVNRMFEYLLLVLKDIK